MSRIYFLGIGGVSMSALAILLKKMGNLVEGSDEIEGRGTELLEKEGICVDFKFNKEKIRLADEICFSSAIREDNEQFIFAKSLGKNMFSRGQILGRIAQSYKRVIAVAGAHGKTTTTAMIYNILKCAGKNPTLHLGGYKIDDGLNYFIGSKDYFVSEACEYHDNFLYLHPYISVITNIEKEHLDYFKTFENEKKSFQKFREQSQIVIEKSQNFVAKNIQHDDNGRLRFSLFEKNKKILDLQLKLCEEINAQNCIYAYRVAKLLEIEDEKIKEGLESFEGISTRFEKVKSPFFETVICDYAHHPTEIKKAINSAKKIYEKQKVVVIFQPHTFSRTKNLLKEFVSVFSKCDEVLFFKTYPAREKPCEGTTSRQLMLAVKEKNKNVKYFQKIECLCKFLIQKENKNTILLFVGAGDLPAMLNKIKFIS